MKDETPLSRFILHPSSLILLLVGALHGVEGVRGQRGRHLGDVAVAHLDGHGGIAQLGHARGEQDQRQRERHPPRERLRPQERRDRDDSRDEPDPDSCSPDEYEGSAVSPDAALREAIAPAMNAATPAPSLWRDRDFNIYWLGQTLSGLGESPAQLALLISCVGRKMILNQRVEEEVEGVREVLGPSPALTGFYSYGEIAPLLPQTRCELHNQTMTITAFAEL